MTERAAGQKSPPAFTLVELLVAVAVLAGLILLFAGLLHQTSTIWGRTTGQVEQFRGAREGFEAMTTRLAQATLNTHWDYDSQSAPTKYERRSELRFISGPADEVLGVSSAGWERPTHAVFFQAPLGTPDEATPAGFENLLSSWGYYVEYRDDFAERPAFITEAILPARFRPRLMELGQPARQNTIYQFTSGLDGSGLARSRSYAGRQWFQETVNAAQPAVHKVADNVVALILTPRLAQADEAAVAGAGAGPDFSPLAPDYLYDTAPPAPGSLDPRYKDGRLNPVHQLPPLLQVTIVTVDEASLGRLNLQAATPDVFGLKDRFRRTTDYTRDLLQTGDVDSLENQLIARRLNYRIFSTTVLLRGAQWSRAQTN